MAQTDFIAFVGGEDLMFNPLGALTAVASQAGMPSYPLFALSTFAVADFQAHLGTSVTNAASIAEIAGGSYNRATMAAPIASGGNLQYGTASWFIPTAAQLPNAVKSIVLLSSPSAGSGASGIPYCAWNLIPGGTPVDLSQAQTTLEVTPLLWMGT